MSTVVDPAVIRQAQRLNTEHALGLTPGRVNRIVRRAVERGHDPDAISQWFVPLAHRDPTGETAVNNVHAQERRPRERASAQVHGRRNVPLNPKDRKN